MKKLTKYYNRIDAIAEELDTLIYEIENAKDEIENKAIENDRPFTDAEEERYRYLDEEQDNIVECINNLNSALDYIASYT